MRQLILLALVILSTCLSSCEQSRQKESKPQTSVQRPKPDTPALGTVLPLDQQNMLSNRSSAIPEDRRYKVRSFYGGNEVDEVWQRPTPSKPYHVGVLFPTLNDSYWMAANYGIVTHARRLGVKITLFDADGYTNFGEQRRQLEWMAANPEIDGILLATVNYSKMDPFIERISNKPVIGLINDIRTSHVKAKSTYPAFDMGYKATEYMLQDAEGKDISVCILPGPEKSGWAEQSHEGITAAIATLKKPNQQVRASMPLYGDTRPKVQAVRIHYFMDDPRNQNTSYILGNAVAAIEATNYLNNNRARHPQTKVIATYLTIGVYEAIIRGEIIAAPIDKTIDLSEIALDLMVRYLNGEKVPHKVMPFVSIITPTTASDFSYERLFGERNFKPLFHTLQEKR